LFEFYDLIYLRKIMNILSREIKSVVSKRLMFTRNCHTTSKYPNKQSSSNLCPKLVSIGVGGIVLYLFGTLICDKDD